MDCIDFDALEDQARRRMTPPADAFCAAGADDEISARENVEAWRRLRLRPRVMRDISTIDTGVSLLGTRVAAPIIVAPTGRHRLFHTEGECATARGATAAGAVYTVSTAANMPLEAIAAARGEAPQWFQLYLWPQRSEVEALLDRVAEAGFGGLMLTVDAPVSGWSPRAARRPHVPTSEVRNVNLPGAPMARTAYDVTLKGKLQYPATFRDLEWLVKRTPLPVMVKGVLRGDDAMRSVDAGARAVAVSNHGGRHLDTTVTTQAALVEVAAAIGSKAELYVDGGIRRGTDILKALALGARAVMIGRPVIWGLAVDGADGVAAVLEHLRDELVRAMQLTGSPTLADITSDLVAP